MKRNLTTLEAAMLRMFARTTAARGHTHAQVLEMTQKAKGLLEKGDCDFGRIYEAYPAPRRIRA